MSEPESKDLRLCSEYVSTGNSLIKLHLASPAYACCRLNPWSKPDGFYVFVSNNAFVAKTDATSKCVATLHLRFS